MARRLMLSITALCAFACSPDPYDRLEAAQTEAAAIACRCSPFGEPAECEAHTAEVLACARGNYEAFPDELRPLTECAADAMEAYAACLRDIGEACDWEVYESCTEALNAGLDICPPISAEVHAMLESCE